MSGGFMDENDPAFRFPGWRFYFNSYTRRGRFNYVAATYGSLAALFLISKMRGKKDKKEIAAK